MSLEQMSHGQKYGAATYVDENKAESKFVAMRSFSR
jgi:hypothetical protein